MSTERVYWVIRKGEHHKNGRYWDDFNSRWVQDRDEAQTWDHKPELEAKMVGVISTCTVRPVRVRVVPKRSPEQKAWLGLSENMKDIVVNTLLDAVTTHTSDAHKNAFQVTVNLLENMNP